jgi:glutamate synthase (NADPH/NADH) small chain
MTAEGVVFHYNAHVGVSVSAGNLIESYDAIALAGGAEASRDLAAPGRDLAGIHFAMDFLPQQNRRVSGEPLGTNDVIFAAGKHVVVIGGGDTGSDCIGTSRRQGALSITQLEILPRPPDKEDKLRVWPDWPLKLRTSSSHEEGAEREFSVKTAEFVGENGVLKALRCVKVDDKFNEIPGSSFSLKADLVLLAMGFVSPVKEGMLERLGLALDPRGNVAADTRSYAASRQKVFACGDMRRGQSLVVWAIREGRQCAASIDEFLMGETDLPR